MEMGPGEDELQLDMGHVDVGHMDVDENAAGGDGGIDDVTRGDVDCRNEEGERDEDVGEDGHLGCSQGRGVQQGEGEQLETRVLEKGEKDKEAQEKGGDGRAAEEADGIKVNDEINGGEDEDEEGEDEEGEDEGEGEEGEGKNGEAHGQTKGGKGGADKTRSGKGKGKKKRKGKGKKQPTHNQKGKSLETYSKPGLSSYTDEKEPSGGNQVQYPIFIDLTGDVSFLAAIQVSHVEIFS